jgi:hypothetical protein
MVVDLIFNERSFLPRSATVVDARTKMSRFADIVKDARVSGCGGVVRVPNNFRFESLAPGYALEQWLVDGAADRDKRLYLGALGIKLPYFEDILGSPASERFDRSEFQFGNAEVHGLGVAFVVDGIAISLVSDAPWHGRFISITYRTVDEVSDTVTGQDVSVRHISEAGHATLHLAEMANQRLLGANSGEELWELCDGTLDRIAFCASVEPQVKALTPGAGGLNVIKRTLGEVQSACRLWLEGGFDCKWIPNTSPEGEATLKKYSEERTFTKPDGTSAVFSLHIKRGNLRIHFIPDAVSHSCLIGYIGPHLRTVRNKA